MSVIVLNVGGVSFQTFKSTLIKSEYFRKMFEFTATPTMPIFIDCDPDGFKHILEYLRFGNYLIPNHYRYLAPYFNIDENAFVPDMTGGNKIDLNHTVRIDEEDMTITDAISIIEQLVANPHKRLGTNIATAFTIMANLAADDYVYNFLATEVFLSKTIKFEEYTRHDTRLSGKKRLICFYHRCSIGLCTDTVIKYILDFTKLFKPDYYDGKLFF